MPSTTRTRRTIEAKRRAKKQKDSLGGLRPIGLPENLTNRGYIDRLKYVHWPIMIYTGIHSIINVALHAQASVTDNGFVAFFLLLSAGGIIGLEFVAFNLFHAVVERVAIGSQKWVCVLGYALIMSFIGFGIMAHYNGANGVSAFYYQNLMPWGGIVALIIVLVVYLIDPFKNSLEEESSLALEGHLLTKRLRSEKLRYHVREQRSWMLLDWFTFDRRLTALWKVARSRRIGRQLRQSAQEEFRNRLVTVHKMKHLPPLKKWGVSLPWLRNPLPEPQNEPELAVGGDGQEDPLA